MLKIRALNCFIEHTHCPRCITPSIEGGMSISPPSTIGMSRGEHCEKTHQEQPNESHFPENKNESNCCKRKQLKKMVKEEVYLNTLKRQPHLRHILP